MRSIPESIKEQISAAFEKVVRSHDRIITSTSPTAYKYTVTKGLEFLVDMLLAYDEQGLASRLNEAAQLHKKISAPGMIRHLRSEYHQLHLQLELLANEWAMMSDDDKRKFHPGYSKSDLKNITQSVQTKVPFTPNDAKPHVQDLYGDDPNPGVPGEQVQAPSQDEVSPAPEEPQLVKNIMDNKLIEAQRSIDKFLGRNQESPDSPPR